MRARGNIGYGTFLVHTNSISAKREKEAVTLVIRVHTMWYEEKVSNFGIAVAKLKETLQNVKFATLCPERSVGSNHVTGPRFVTT